MEFAIQEKWLKEQKTATLLKEAEDGVTLLVSECSYF